MGKVKEFFGNPGDRPGVHCQAPIPVHHHTGSDAESDTDEKLRSAKDADGSDPTHTCSVASVSDSSDAAELSSVTIQQNGTYDISRGFTGLHKGYMDRILDKLVLFAGTITVFYCVWIILIIWVVLGAVYNAPFNWQVVMQDGQSIQCYIWDTLLMRQQLSSGHEQLLVCANLRSRMASFQRMLGDWAKSPQHNTAREQTADTVSHNSQCEGDCACACGASATEKEALGQLPIENWYDRVSNYSAVAIGSVAAMVLFWICIIVWIGCGAIPQAGDTSAPFTGRTTGSNPQYKMFSNAWQMDINTAVAVSLLICTTFLQNIRARHDRFIAKILLEVFSRDERIDIMLRDSLGDYKPHPVINIPEAKRSWLQRVIDWYADIIGTGIGVIIAIIVFGVWIGIGTPLHWGDDWWLIIGTYTGLVGFIDGYVLREVYYRAVNEEEKNYAQVIEDDLAFMQQLGVPNPRDIVDSLEEQQAKVTGTMHYKISAFVNVICSHQYSVVLGVLIVVGLICASSGMKWSTTGQLIANTPTMIIEEFFLIVLIQAHNWADVQRRLEMSTILAHRRIMEARIEELLG